MSLSEIHKLYSDNQQIEDIYQFLQVDNLKKCHIKGGSGSIKSFIISSLTEKGLNSNLILINDKEDAAYLYDDLVKCMGKENVY